jgi:hypothetical protein
MLNSKLIWAIDMPRTVSAVLRASEAGLVQGSQIRQPDSNSAVSAFRRLRAWQYMSHQNWGESSGSRVQQ